jgi:uncharacterized protein (TIGR02466 family)
MPVTAYFPTLIYEAQLDVDNSKLLEKALNLRKNDSSVSTSWFCDTYNSIGKYNIAEDEQFKSFVDQCMDHTKLFAREYGLENPTIKTRDGWMNVAMQNEYQEVHIHPNSHFSMAYYVSVPENCGSIIFRSPESNTDMFQLPNGSSFATMKTVSIKPTSGKLVIFRSNLLHMVEKNKNILPRVSVSMNVVLND